jgi:hypothetical protein
MTFAVGTVLRKALIFQPLSQPMNQMLSPLASSGKKVTRFEQLWQVSLDGGAGDCVLGLSRYSILLTYKMEAKA